ncbi:DUF3331 domain-containing protein [Paraburkholderia sp. GAS348]|jgi:hypothetical protein|uniref:DUF3331 domain-containing protein n=1 Tax=Paraburkholderia sp. GAS348 TaxID=3035132 RepID=UPI003D21183A
MLNAEPNTASDILSENGLHDTSTAPDLPSIHHPSSRRPGRLAQSKSTCRTSSPKGSDPWATMVASIHQFSSPPDPLRNSPDLSGRSCSAGGLFRPRETDGGDVRTFTVTVVEELSNSLFVLCWRDPTLCNYEDQVWSPCLARASGRCALSGKHIGRGDPVYRPRTRGRGVPLNGDAMILASEMVKVRTSA